MGLSFRDLHVRLGSRTALSGIEAALRPGRVTAILGPNGAGKSTLLKTAIGLLTPAQGSVRLDDRPIDSLSRRARGQAIGYLPQEASVHWDVRARDLVSLGRAPHRGPFAALSATDRLAIDEAMAATETTAFADRLMSEMSGGERARVLLARVLAGTPRWLIADEPLASLDPAHQADILQRLRAIAEAGTGIAIVLHDLMQAARLADDVLILKQGRLAAFGPAGEVLTAERLRAVYGVEVFIGRDDHGQPLLVPLGRSQ